MKKLCEFIILCAVFTVYPFSLDYLNTFLALHEESPQFTNKNTLNPNYRSYYEKFLRHWYSPTSWLGKHTDEREKFFIEFGFLLSQAKKVVKNLDNRMKIDKPKKFIVFGDLLGDIHTFGRSLNELYKEGIIDQNLTLKKDCYLVLLGNVVTGVHSVELLSLLFHLIVHNKDNVIYLSGTYERDQYWHDFSTAHELKILKDNSVSLEKDLDDLFSQLPHSLWLDYKDAHQEDAEFLFSYEGFNSFALEPRPQLKTQICSENPGFTYRENEGLDFDLPQQGVSTWRLFSCPDKRMQSLYHFFYDSFVILDAAPDVFDWTITLYSRDVRQEGFFEKKYRNARTGQKITKEKKNELLKKRTTFLKPIKDVSINHEDELVVGCTLDLSSMNAFKGERLLKGLMLAFNKLNIQNGGVKGRFIRLVALDGKYSDHLTKQCMEDLYQEFKTNVLITCSGTGPLLSAMKTIKKYNFLMLFPYSGALQFRQVDAFNFINFRVSYDLELTVLVNQACFNLGIKHFAILYEDSEFGRLVLKSAREKLAAFKGSEILAISYQQNALINRKAAQQLSDFHPGGIFFFINQYQTEAFIRSMNLDILNGVSLFGTSMLPIDVLKFLSKRGLTMMKTETVPSPLFSTLSIVDDYKKDLRIYMPEELMTTQSLEAYINARFLLAAIDGVSSLNRDAISSWFEKLNKYKFDGLELSFNEKQRQIAHYLWLNDGGKWEKIG